MTLAAIGKIAAADQIARLNVFSSFSDKTEGEKLQFISAIYQEINSLYNDADKSDYLVDTFTDPLGAVPGVGAGIDAHDGILLAGETSVQVDIAGLLATSKVFVAWGVNASIPIGTPYISDVAEGYVIVESTAEEESNMNVVVVVYEY